MLGGLEPQVSELRLPALRAGPPTQTRNWPLLWEEKHLYTRHYPLCLPSYLAPAPLHFFLTCFLEKPFSAVPVPSEVKE